MLTTFTVLADLARNVAGDRLTVRSIVKPGSEIHGYQPTPSDIERASDADLIVMERRLMDWIETQDLSPVSDPQYAFYDAPMIPGPLRRNEILVELAAE